MTTTLARIVVTSKLPEAASDLIEAALADLEKAEQDPKTQINMGIWLSTPVTGKCELCLAGCVMRYSLDVHRIGIASPSLFEDRALGNKLESLNYFRVGKIVDAFDQLGMSLAEAVEIRDKLRTKMGEQRFTPSCLRVPAYETSPDLMKRTLSELAIALRALGY